MFRTIMNLSRRELLRAGGGAFAGVAVAGCVEERVTAERTNVESSGLWSISPETADVALTREAFETYAERMQSQYGESGVWGLSAEQADDFETAYVQRLAITRETPGDAGGTEVSLVPDNVDPDAPLLISNACVVVYDLGDGRRRYWLWTAADATEGRLVRDVSLNTLSTGIRIREGSLTDAAEPSVTGEEVSVNLGTPPTGSFPLNNGAIRSTRITGVDGRYTVEWNGRLDGTQSVNGVCEVEVSGEHRFMWESSLGYSYEETV